LVLNTEDENVLDTYKKFNFKKIYYVDATKIALENIGKAIPNGSMLGMLAATGLVEIESVEKAVKTVFGERAGDKNAKAAREAYKKTKEI